MKTRSSTKCREKGNIKNKINNKIYELQLMNKTVDLKDSDGHVGDRPTVLFHIVRVVLIPKTRTILSNLKIREG